MNLDSGNGVERVKITILSDNTTDITLQTDPLFEGRVVQPRRKVIAALAEHGLAMMIEIDGKSILYDFGGFGLAILKNIEVLNINPTIFQKAVLSHGHFDHFGALMKMLPMMGPSKEVIISPEIYKQKIVYVGDSGEKMDINQLKANYKTLKKEGKIQEMPIIKKKMLDTLIKDHSQNLIETRMPLELMPGVWTSGEIEILDKSELTENLFLLSDGANFEEETFRDEIALYIRVKNKGLVVLTGCGHTGIINIIKHGQKLLGLNKIYAVIGGFHLNWCSEEHINQVLSYFQEMDPTIISGMHCTGFNFNSKLFSLLPKTASLAVVGTTFYL
jgi:7,8-dihydropterin-6-yl-methyl-4-(beta-D-ribofuranosyl)aminobenzene 5'-phosphate synthase